jgi:hypothetical protein
MSRCPSQCACTFLTILLLALHPGFAQETLFERLSEQEAESSPAAEDALQELLSHPLEVNRVTRQDLLRLPFLTGEQIGAFLARREKSGGFKNLDEALAALAVTGDTLALSRELFFLSPPKRDRTLKTTARWRITHPATTDAKWLGAPYRSYERATLASGQFSLGLLAERDPGEQRWDDHRLFYGRWQHGTADKGWQLLAGDYQIEWAQGLVFWGPYATNVSTDVHAARRRQGRGLLPYLSGDENAALRGAGFTWKRRHFALLAFASSQRLNARLNDSLAALNFHEAGYHRLPTELARRKTVGEQILGAAIKVMPWQRLAFGLLAYRSQYDKTWVRPDKESGYFDFTGQKNDALSFSLSWTASELEINFEMAQSRSGGKAGSAVISGGDSRLRWTVESHYYARDLHSPHGRDANGDLPQNEFGYSLGISSRPVPTGLIAEIFAAKTQELWSTSAMTLPAAKLVTGARIDWKIRRDMAMHVRWQQTRDEALARRSGRLKLEYQAAPALRLTSRLDFARRYRLISQALEPQKLALALSQELRWSVRRQLLVSSRYVFFDTPAGTPIYQYERDLPGMFTNFALRESGRRWYIYVHYLLSFGFELSLKLACSERNSSIFERVQSCSWGIQLDWWSPLRLP